jgi:hypothetical protein
MASIEYNGRTFTRLCATYSVAKTDINLSFAPKFLTSASAAIAESLSVTENCICKFGRDTVKWSTRRWLRLSQLPKVMFWTRLLVNNLPRQVRLLFMHFTPGGEISIISCSSTGGLSLTIAPVSTLCQPQKSTIMFQLASLSQIFR